MFVSGCSAPILGSSPEASLHSLGIPRVARDELETSELEATQCNTKHAFESACVGEPKGVEKATIHEKTHGSHDLKQKRVKAF